MKKGSASGYDAETGEESAGSESSLGEPYEYPSLYRIRRSQENHQFLCQDCRRRDRGRRRRGGATRGIAAVGCGPAANLAGSDGSDLVQRLDIRHAAALQRAVGDGASRQNESHQRGQEEKRHARRPHHCRPGALQSFTRVLCGPAAHSRTAPPAALSQPGGERSGTDEEQNGRTADGNRRPLREGKITPKEILRQSAGRSRRGAAIGDRSAALEPRRAGNVREHAEAAGARVARRFRTCRTRRTVDDDSSRRRNYRSDLGPGGRRPATLPLQLRCHELLRTDRRFEVFGGQAATRTDLQTAQPLAANHADRGRQAGPAMESATGGAACPRTGTRTSQPGHTGRGAQTRRLSAGGRQKPSALPSAPAVGRANTKSCLTRKNFELSGDRPAVPRQLGDWAEELLLPMLLTVCIEAGRRTLTHTSWIVLTPASRKWMSGQAAALVATQDRTPFANLSAPRPLRDPTLPSARRPPSPLDFYLSWMSPGFSPGFLPGFSCPRVSLSIRSTPSKQIGQHHQLLRSCSNGLFTSWEQRVERSQLAHSRSIHIEAAHSSRFSTS